MALFEERAGRNSGKTSRSDDWAHHSSDKRLRVAPRTRRKRRNYERNQPGIAGKSYQIILEPLLSPLSNETWKRRATIELGVNQTRL